jgi:hypothetical protein
MRRTLPGRSKRTIAGVFPLDGLSTIRSAAAVPPPERREPSISDVPSSSMHYQPENIEKRAKRCVQAPRGQPSGFRLRVVC